MPGTEYLSPTATISISYLYDGLCKKDSVLYSELHCSVCRARRYEVTLVLLWVAIVLEHMLLLLKVFLAFVVPDIPGYIVRAGARADFKRKHDGVPATSQPGASHHAELQRRVSEEAEGVNEETDVGDGSELVVLNSGGRPRHNSAVLRDRLSSFSGVPAPKRIPRPSIPSLNAEDSASATPPGRTDG